MSTTNNAEFASASWSAPRGHSAEEVIARLQMPQPAPSDVECQQILESELLRKYGESSSDIESHLEVCGGAPCIARTRIPVWVLEQARRLGLGLEDLMRCYPTLRPEDITAAWTYAASHQAEIEQQIHENEAT